MPDDNRYADNGRGEWGVSVPEQARRHIRVPVQRGWELVGTWIDESSPITASSSIRSQEALAREAVERGREISEHMAIIMQREWRDFLETRVETAVPEGVTIEEYILAPTSYEVVEPSPYKVPKRSKRVHAGMQLLAEAERRIREPK